jgi:hypothetical protein
VKGLRDTGGMNNQPEGPSAFKADELTVRVIEPGELARWQAVMQAHHYLGFRRLVGERLYQIAEYRGRWVALIGWAAAAYRCRARDLWIGWTPDQRRRRLRYVANNVRFLILPDVQWPNLGSAVLARATRRLADDWRAVHGHPVVLAETFVDPTRFAGTVYRAANWAFVGHTLGFGRHHGTYRWHGQPKRVAVYPLHRLARTWLTAVWDVPAFGAGGAPIMALTSEALVTAPTSLYARLGTVPDARKPRGVRHRYQTILTIALAAVATGATSLLAIGQWAAQLTQEQLALVGASRFKGRFVAPSESAIRRALQRSDADALDRILTEWMADFGLDDAVAFDGTTVRGSASADQPARHLVAAVVHGTTRVVAQQEVDCKTNEIPVAYDLLAPLALAGKMVTADAMHTQTKLAAYLVTEKQADYLFVAKGNQEPLSEAIRALEPEDFSPSGRNLGQGPRTDRTPGPAGEHGPK